MLDPARKKELLIKLETLGSTFRRWQNLGGDPSKSFMCELVDKQSDTAWHRNKGGSGDPEEALSDALESADFANRPLDGATALLRVQEQSEVIAAQQAEIDRLKKFAPAEPQPKAEDAKPAEVSKPAEPPKLKKLSVSTS